MSAFRSLEVHGDRFTEPEVNTYLVPSWAHGIELAYLATPYSRYPGGIEKAFEDAAALAGRLIAQGVHVYSPIAHTHPIAVYGELDPLDHAMWLALDEKMLAACDVLLIAELDGWSDSIGIQYERDVFEEAGKPVLYLEPETLEVRR